VKLYERFNKRYPLIKFEPLEEENSTIAEKFLNLHHAAKIPHPCFDFYILKTKYRYEVREYFFKPKNQKLKDISKIISHHKNEFKAFELFLDKKTKVLNDLNKSKKKNHIYRSICLILFVSSYFFIDYYSFGFLILGEILEYRVRKYNRDYVDFQIKELFWINFGEKDVP
jgi:hypothetical protein